MASSLPPTVSVLDNCRVCPSADGLPVLGVESLPLTFFDVFWLRAPSVEYLFLYNWPVTTADFVASAFPRLKRSLSSTLRHYYPLAGTLRYNPGSDKFEIHCTGGDSVAFTLAECVDGDLLELAGDQARRPETLKPFVPEIPASPDDDHGCRTWALMALQMTVFPGAGVSIGVSIKHVVCDGSSYTRFVKSWAAACRSSDDAIPLAGELPLIDRTLVSDPKELYTVFWNRMKSSVCGEVVPPPRVGGPEVVRSTFLLRQDHVETLRRRASESRPGPFRYSSFVLTCAHVWVCRVKSAEQPLQDGDDAYFSFSVDCRSRLRPPLPASYFGNCVGVCFVDARSSDLVGEGGIGCAAAAIAESIARLDEEGVLEGADQWMAKAAARSPRRMLAVAGSPRFGVYGVDFGWGRPAKVDVLGLEKTGSMALAESREVEGDIEIGLALPVPEMAKFGSLFAAGLQEESPSPPDC